MSSPPQTEAGGDQPSSRDDTGRIEPSSQDDAPRGEPRTPDDAVRRETPTRDDVDRVIDAWHRERPGLDLRPLGILSRVSRLARHLDLARERAFAAHGLAAWEFDVLVALRRSGPPYRLTPGQLVAQTLVTSGTMTNRIDRLTARDLVVRQPVPGDQRAIWVALTAAGLERADAAFEDLLAAERELLAALAEADREPLADSLRSLLLQFESPNPPSGGQSA